MVIVNQSIKVAGPKTKTKMLKDAKMLHRAKKKAESGDNNRFQIILFTLHKVN